MRGFRSFVRAIPRSTLPGVRAARPLSAALKVFPINQPIRLRRTETQLLPPLMLARKYYSDTSFKAFSLSSSDSDSDEEFVDGDYDNKINWKFREDVLNPLFKKGNTGDAVKKFQKWKARTQVKMKSIIFMIEKLLSKENVLETKIAINYIEELVADFPEHKFPDKTKELTKVLRKAIKLCLENPTFKLEDKVIKIAETNGIDMGDVTNVNNCNNGGNNVQKRTWKNKTNADDEELPPGYKHLAETSEQRKVKLEKRKTD